MTTIRKILLTLALAAMAAPAAAREAQLTDPGKIHLTVADGTAASATKVRNAIVLAGMARGWTLVEEQPGRLKLTFNKADKHRATIEVHGVKAVDERMIARIVAQFTGGAYGWMWPFPRTVRRWIDEVRGPDPGS